MANADDPMVVWAVGAAAQVVWVATGSRWTDDASACPRCGRTLHRSSDGTGWRCGCGLTRPSPHWTAGDASAETDGRVIPVPLQLPGAFNVGNAVTAIAAATALGLDPCKAAASMSTTSEVAGRYAVMNHRGRQARMLLAKNPAGWAETLYLLGDRPLLLAVNAREADGRDTSWLWDVPFENLRSRRVVASGENFSWPPPVSSKVPFRRLQPVEPPRRLGGKKSRCASLASPVGATGWPATSVRAQRCANSFSLPPPAGSAEAGVGPAGG